MLASGNIGHLQVKYHRAVTLTRWRLTTRPETVGGDQVSDITAVANITDRYWSSQSPMDLYLSMGEDGQGHDVYWVWKGVPVDGAIDHGSTIQIVVKGTPTVRRM